VGGAARFNTPGGIAVDRRGVVSVADTANHAIRRVSANGVITTVAGNNFNGFRGDGSPAPSAMLDTPTSVLASPTTDEFFIADSKNHRVRRVSNTGIITTYAGTVAGSGFSGDGNVAVFAQLSFPTALAFDRTGRLYIADAGNNRIRRIDLAGTITSLPDESLASPMGVAVAADGAVLVADTANHRLRRIDDMPRCNDNRTVSHRQFPFRRRSAPRSLPCAPPRPFPPVLGSPTD
jgi:sugar lactone lactonase YvrE